MTISFAVKTYPPKSGVPARFVEVTFWGASSSLLATVLLIVLALQSQHQRFVRTSPWQMAKWLAATIPLEQGSMVLIWALITGGLLALGTRQARRTRRLAWGTLAAGLVIPIGLLLLGHQLNRLWPGTRGPTDAPMLTLLLVAYSVIVPYALGRLLTGSEPALGTHSA